MVFVSEPDERQSLLSHKEGEEDSSLLHEIRVLVQYSTPLLATNYLRTFVQAASILCLAQLGTRELAAANLGNVTVNVLGYGLQIGLVSSLDTLSTQAVKSSSPKLTSIYAMRAFVVCCITMPPIYVVLWNAEFILTAILPNAESEMIHMTALHVKVASLGIPPLAAFECLRRYLGSMGILQAPTVVWSLVAPFSIALNYCLTFHGFGYIGSPLAIVVTFWAVLLGLMVYTYLAAPRYAWAGLSLTIFEDLGLNFRYGLAGIVSTCSECTFCFATQHVLIFECSAGLGATYLGEVPQAVNSIASTMGSLCWQLPLAISQSSALRVGNHVGSNRPRKAKSAARAAQILAFCITGLGSVGITLGRHAFGRAFSVDPAVTLLFDRMAWLVAIVALPDGIQGGCAGVLRGAGLSTTASRINIFSYWMLGMPFGALVTVKIQEVEGLWLGAAFALFFTATLLLYKVDTCDWNLRAEEARDRIATSDAVIHHQQDIHAGGDV